MFPNALMNIANAVRRPCYDMPELASLEQGRLGCRYETLRPRLVYSGAMKLRMSKTQVARIVSKPSSRLYPVFLTLSGRRVLVVGAGEVAAQKVAQLLPTGALITVIAPASGNAVQALAVAHPEQIILLHQAFSPDARPNPLLGYDLVITATDNPALNARVVSEARRLKIWANSVDDPEHCDFYAASTIDRGPLRIAISSEGRYPGLSAALRRFLEDILPDEHSDDLMALADLRDRLKQEIPDVRQRGKILKALAQEFETRYLRGAGEVTDSGC